MSQVPVDNGAVRRLGFTHSLLECPEKDGFTRIPGADNLEMTWGSFREVIPEPAHDVSATQHGCSFSAQDGKKRIRHVRPPFRSEPVYEAHQNPVAPQSIGPLVGLSGDIVPLHLG